MISPRVEFDSNTNTVVVRIFHSVTVVDGCSTKDTGKNESLDISMFKTIKLTSKTSSKQVIDILSQKLTLKDRENFSLYSVDAQTNSSMLIFMNVYFPNLSFVNCLFYYFFNS